MSYLPILGQAFSSRAVKGLDTFPPDPRLTWVMSVAEPAEILLRREYGTDAHFCTYFPTEHGHYDGSEYPRVNKIVLPSIRAIPGGDVMSSWLVYDLDNPGHRDHSTAHEAHELLHDLWMRDRGIPLPHFAYTTRGGARLGYALSAPLPVDVREQLHQAFGERGLRAAGIPVDAACGDWTRFFRSPKVRRDPQPGAPLESAYPWFVLRIAEDAQERPLIDPSALQERFDAHPIPPRSPAPLVRPLVRVEGDAPTDEECAELLDDAQLMQEARRRCMNRLCDPVLFRDEELAQPGHRSDRIHQLVGDAVRWIVPIPGASPDLVYALFWVQVAGWGSDSVPSPFTHHPRGWLLHLWEAVTRYWAREYARLQELPKEPTKDPREASPPAPGAVRGSIEHGAPTTAPGANRLLTVAQRQLSMLTQMRQGIETWPNPPFGPDTPNEEAQRWILRHLILVMGSGKEEFYLLRPDGFYEVGRIGNAALIPALRDLRLDECGVSLDEISATGRPRPRSATEIVRDHGTRIVRRAMRVGIIGPDGTPGGVLATRHGVQVMDYSTFARRTDLVAQFDTDVDEWLHQLAGDDYITLERWLSWALAFEEGPICALMLQGAPGVGKKLIARGLTECVAPIGQRATGHDLGGRHIGFLRSPFMIVDEGIPDSVAPAERADVFRQLIAGEWIRAADFYQAPVDIQNPVRALFTCNDIDMVMQLAGGRDLAVDSRRAVTNRLLHIAVPDRCSVWLEQRGGIRWTKGWIDSDGGEPGQARVARHILHLYALRHRHAVGSRFLVEGRPDPLLQHTLLMSTTTSGQMVEAIVRRIEAGGSGEEIELEGDKVWVTSQAVIDSLRRISRSHPGVKVPGTRAVAAAIKAWCYEGAYSIQRGRGARWHGLNLEQLLEEANTQGLPCTQLRRIIETKGEGMDLKPRLGVVEELKSSNFKTDRKGVA